MKIRKKMGSMLLLLLLIVIITVPKMSMANQPPSTATLNVIKHVNNDNGGTAVAGDFNLHVMNISGNAYEVVGSPAPGVESPGTTYTLAAGTYTVSEDPFNPRYYASYSGDIDNNYNITLAPGDNKTVIITNAYLSDLQWDNLNGVVPKLPAILHVIKHVINDNFGTAVAADFNLHVKTTSGIDVGGSPAPGMEAPGTTYTLAAGTYAVSEDAVAGYTTSYSGDSDSIGNITLKPGDNKTVTITNNDIHPPGTAFLHVIKHVINDSGGTAVAADFNLHVKTAAGNEINGSPAPGMEAPGTTYMMYFFMPGPIPLVISEDAVAGYTASYSGDSDSSGNITLNPGNNKTVIITNNDIPVQPPAATLNVIKHVINDSGGTAVAADFNLHVKTTSGIDVGGSPAPGNEAGTTYTLPAGTYAVSEDAFAWYTASYSGDSDSNGNITLNPGDNKTIIITNNDIQSPHTAILQVIKHVINDSGGTAVAADFNLHVKTASGNEINGSPAPGVEAPGTTYILNFMAGPTSLVVSEDAFAGYTASYSGDSDSSGNITLYPGDIKTVTITNDDIPVKPPTATLHVIKHVINDSGGTAVAGNFKLHVKTASGIDVGGSPAPGDESGTTYTLPAGTYVVSEDTFAGYTKSYSGDSDSSGNITLNPGDNKTVTITNNDIIKIIPKPFLDFTYGYINGYDTGNVGAEDPLTREEVSASLYRIFKQAGKITNYIKPVVSDFSDLATNRWSYAAVEYMVSIGAIPKGATVKPTQPVTRGEMAKIIAMSNKMTNNESVVKFPDLPESHMYHDYLNMLVNHGLVKGYPDGLIKPDGLITRAEYVTMVNRFIGRDNRYYVSGLPSLYWDLQPTHWAFAELQRASFGFTTTVDSNGFFQVDPNQKISKADLDN